MQILPISVIGIYYIQLTNLWGNPEGKQGSKLFYYHMYYTTMNKAALVEYVHGKMGGTKVASEELVDGMIAEIIKTLKKGDEVSIAGLGIFSVKARAARMARNPKTGEQVKVAATKVPKFRPAKALKDAIK